MTKIENLTRHQKENISLKACVIIETFFAQEKYMNTIPQAASGIVFVCLNTIILDFLLSFFLI